MTMKIFIIIYYIIILCVCTFVNCAKLNTRRLLLPYNNGVSTNFTLIGDNNGCYHWTSSRVDVAIVEPVIDPKRECSREAHVNVVSRIPKKQSTVIFATDKVTGTVIRCDVEIDVIAMIEIVTETREIVLEDLPEKLEVKAKNDKNDTFTSIGGIQFEWTLIPLDILRYRTWSSSSYTASPFIKYWESRELKGAIILIEGIRTGSAKVRVRIIGDAYYDVKSAETTLHVIANLGLIPSHDIYLIRGAKIEIKAEIAKQGPRVPLKLPSPQYFLEILDSNIATLDESESIVEAVEYGDTSLILRDRNVDISDGGRQPTTDIHVMRPSYLALRVSPGENFALSELSTYHIVLSAHDDWHHQLYPAENLNIKITFPSRYFHVDFSSTNGTYHIVRTVNLGNCKINAQLTGAGSYDLPSPIEVTQDVTIYPLLKLNPTLILLPWDPDDRPLYTVYSNANGATGHYRWMTNNTVLSTISYDPDHSSRVTIDTHGEGDTIITCQDVHNSVFISYLRVSVQPINEMEIIPSIVESHIGGDIILPIAVYGYEDEGRKEKRRLFDDCTRIPLDVEIVEKTRIEHQNNNNIPGLSSRSCRSLSFSCKSPGNSRIWIKYGNDNDPQQLKTTTVIGCFLPLTAVHPHKEVVLALGTSIDIAFEGGPRLWSLNPEGHYARLSPSAPSIVSYTPVIDRYRYNKDLHVFEVKCLRYGESTLELEVGNLASATLPNPASVKSQITIICAKPSSMIIKPKLKSGCPLSAPQDNVFPIQRDNTIEIEVDIKDENGRSFYNISTFTINWSIESDFEMESGVREEINAAKGYRKLTRSFQIIKKVTPNVELVKVKADLKGYIKEFRDKFSIEREIELSFVEKAFVDSDRVSILNHPKNKVPLNIRKGSGYFGIEWSKDEYANLTFSRREKALIIIPKNIGSSDVSITDLCLPFIGSTKFHLSIVEAVEIYVKMIDKLQFGSVTEAYVSVFDNNGDPLDVNSHTFLSITPITSNRVVSISKSTIFDDVTSAYGIKSEEIGVSTISFVSRSNQINNIESTPITIEIFSPFRILPSNLTLLIGNHFQVTCVGGPQPQKSPIFSINDERTATVESNGLVTGIKLGKTKLISRITNVEGYEYSRAEIEIFVVPLKRVKIISPTNQLQVNAKLPLYIIGDNEFETPFSFGNANPPLKVQWSISNTDVASIEHTFESSGIIESDSNVFAVRIIGNSPGTVTVKVSVESVIQGKDSNFQIENNKILTDSLQIRIFPSFSMTIDGRTFKNDIILMSHNSEFPLISNRMGEAEIDYRLINATDTVLLQENDRALKSGKSREVSSLIVKAKEKFGITQNALYGVVVESTSYMLINPSKSFPVKEPLKVFPVGSLFDVRISYHDNSGRTFNSIRTQVHWRVSRNDLIMISRGPLNSTLRIRALKEGKTIVKVFDDDNNAFDYISISTGFVLEPPKLNLSIGEVTCMRSKFTSPGLWSIDNELVAEIDPHFGVIIGRGIGNAIVVWNSSIGLVTHSEVSVLPPKEFKLDTSELKGITNTITHKVPIIITGQIFSKNCASINYDYAYKSSFECNISFEKASQIKSIWQSSVVYDSTTGQWNCQFEPKSAIISDEFLNANYNVIISASIILKTNDYDSNFQLEHSVTLPFLPAFHYTPRQVIFTPNERIATISVFSVPLVLDDVVLTSVPEVIKVINTETIDNTKKFIVRLNDFDLVFTNGAFHLHLALNSKLTKQTERISVQIKWNEMRRNDQLSFRDSVREYSIGIVISIIVIVVITMFCWFKSKQQTIQMPPPIGGSPFQSDVSSPNTSLRHRALNYSGSTSISSTPHTPIAGRPLYSVRN